MVKVSAFPSPSSVDISGDLPLIMIGEVTFGTLTSEASSSVYLAGDLLDVTSGDVLASLSPARWTVTKGAWPSRNDSFGYLKWES